MHARQQIREAVKAAVTGLSITGANVFTTRMHKFEDANLPALAIYTLQEEVYRDTMGPAGVRRQERMLRVAIEIAVKQVSDTDEALDDIAAEVEGAIETTWQGGAGLWALLRDFTLNSSVITMSTEGDQRALGLVLTYTAIYRTVEGEPETIIA